MTAPDDGVDHLAEAMVTDWRAGRRHRAEYYLQSLPHVDAAAAMELIAEELALRNDESDSYPVTLDELLARFPQWSEPIRNLFRFHQALGPQPAILEVGFPQAGEHLGDFTLVKELGRGVHSVVFRATQGTLAGRDVVLKLVPGSGAEHLSLARLQHTHIVPLYSVHEFPEQGLRALCMPYFGGETLASLMVKPQWKPDADAIAALGMALADALHYAHERGLLHLDVKPSNVLIAADGTPMLLDFHLAHAPLRPGDPAPHWLGGTPGFMAPEQLAALDAVRNHTAILNPVDARADVFSLGVLLRECHEGIRIPTGLNDIITCCVAPRSGDRYASASAFAADLRRHRADQPLVGVRNRNVVERVRKWRRRHPYAFPILAILAALLIVAVTGVVLSQHQSNRASIALQMGNDLLNRGQYDEAIATFTQGERDAQAWPFRRELTKQLQAGRTLAEKRRIAKQLHDFAEQVRPAYAAPRLTAMQHQVLLSRCREVWSRAGAIMASLNDLPASPPDSQWRNDLQDIGIITAYLTGQSGAETSSKEALAILNDVESKLGPSMPLHYERAYAARLAGLTNVADAALVKAEAIVPVTASDYLLRGRAALGAKDDDTAARNLEQAVRLDPTSLWANYYFGAWALRHRDAPAAMAAFSACVALAPHSAWCVYNRGLAFAANGQVDRATADYTRANELEPEFAKAASNLVIP